MVLTLLRVSALFAVVVATAALHQTVDSRLILPSNLELQAFKLRRAAAASAAEDLPTRIRSYFKGSGFPLAGRSLQQKIDDADAFLTTQLATIGAVGVGTAVVYKDQVVYAKGYGVRNVSDSSSIVSKDDLFQIGSVSKTFIALGVGLLVDDGKLQWNDPVKKHLPWLKLFDPYAQEHVRIGDLLSMNSGLGRSQDPAMDAGKFSSARELVEGLAFSPPESSLRETPAYANANYEMLGQLIEEVSGMAWPVFLKKRIWQPLGMNHTFAAVEDVPTDLQETALNAGHLVCNKDVVGPLAMVNNPVTNISPGYTHLAAGSIVSSAADMAKLLRLVLNKGTVDDVTLFKSPTVVAEMITGKNPSILIGEGGSSSAQLQMLGYEYLPDGNSLSAGYGFDIIGNVLWGRAYVDKGGDTFVHHTTTGYAPNDALGLVLLTNAEGIDIVLGTDQVRSYVMGIFLDVPKDMLDFQLAQWQAIPLPRPVLLPGAPACGFEFWTDAPRLALPAAQSDAFVGEYEATSAPKYFPRVTISRIVGTNQFLIQAARINATVYYVGNASSTLFFLADSGAPVGFVSFTAVPDGQQSGKFVVDVIGQTYRKQ